ncbi:maleylpyruvate isomerase family mycothiol-dependent enzyme [Streptomyces sp. NRRL B-1347]|uniref:maleylpyruvate isomerase family mycothiol-dependent enzyme n=1 Tax=Streptomyces sp. NRRL B-1347 TaxID=1476877 RepID=UPI0004C7F239|nr:maleylpyruvate isomerase family mycothiol-dependent enzyme [Streptomyces sp. NRRL B-1347]
MASRPVTALDLPWLGTPIDARPLFAAEHAALLATLRALEPADWGREAVPGWTVRDLAAHLVGDCYGRLARDRDHHEGGPRPAPGESLEAFIHRVNQEWVDAWARVSPAALTDTLDLVGAQVTRLFETADPDAASLGVSWAGADPAPMWLDCAREFTEFWTHRQQLRHAVGRDSDSDPRFLGVVLDTFMRALPHTLRHTEAPAGTQVQVRVDGPSGGAWTATATGDRWSLALPDAGRPAAVVVLDAEAAWRLCTRGTSPAAALAGARTSGDRRLVEAVGRIVSVVH